MSLIKKPSEIEISGKIKMLIYGQAGMGKTTMALSAPRPLLLDCDNGLKRINAAHITDTVQVKSYADVLAVLNEDISSYDSLVIDTGGKLLDLMGAYLISRNPKLGKANGSLTLQGYGERKAEFSQFCKLVASKDKHLVFVAHRETRTEGDDTRYVPMFGGSNYDSLVTELDLVGYIEANGKQRTVTFNGTSRNDGKNTCNLPSIIEVPTVVDSEGNGLPNHFVENVVLRSFNQHLAKIQALGKEYAEVMAELKDQISLITDDVSANDFVSRINSFKHIGASKAMAAQLLKVKCNELGLKYNATTKVYEYVDAA